MIAEKCSQVVIGLGFVFRDRDRRVRLHAVSQFPTGQQHAVRTGFTLQTDIRAESHDLPGETAAWMGFTQPHAVTKVQIRKHAAIITHVIISKFSTTGWA